MEMYTNNALSNALTRRRAQELCQSLKHLAGTIHTTADEKTGIIECATIAPFDDVNKFIFLEYYRECRNVSTALEFYRIPYFDVVLIVRSPIDGTISLAWLKEGTLHNVFRFQKTSAKYLNQSTS